MPPAVALQGPPMAGVLNWIAPQAIADEGEAPALAAVAQRHQHLGSHFGVGAAELQLGVELIAANSADPTHPKDIDATPEDPILRIQVFRWLKSFRESNAHLALDRQGEIFKGHLEKFKISPLS
jgi:hypothetical protein